MAAAATPAESAPRVPAWKRIGLKLKYAQDTPTEAQPQSTIPPAGPPTIHPEREAFHNPQKRNLDRQQPEIPVKRARVEPAKPAVSQPKAKPTPGSAPKTRTAGQQVWNEEERSSLPAPSGVFKAPGQVAKKIVFGDDDDEISSRPLPIASSLPTPSRPARSNPIRKSVSFTPDTKKYDTNSAQTLIADWDAAEEAAIVESYTRESTEQPVSPSKPSKPAKEPKVKKEKKPKQPKASADLKVGEEAEASSKETPNYVKYLEHFSNDKASWKFNKNRQNDLFKHLFDVDRIPSKYNSALVQYISTTQGQARRRIAEQAEEVLKAIWVRENEDADLMSLDTAEARRAAYYEALASSIERYGESGAGRTQYGDQQLKVILREHEQGARAEELLSKALEDELNDVPSSTPATSVSSTTNDIPKPKPTFNGIPGATRIIETQKTSAGKTTKEIDPTPKRKRSRKSRTDVSSSSESDSDSDSSDDGSSDESEAAPPAKKKPSPPEKEQPEETGDFFSSDVLDKKFGKAQRYNAVAPKRQGAEKGQARGFDFTHGNKADESDSE